MNNKWGLALTAALAAALAALPARAQEAPGRFYMGISGAAVTSDASRSMESITGGVYDESTPNGGKVYAGYLRGNWGLEFGYYYLGKYEIENAGGQVQDVLETSAIVVAGVYQVEMWRGFDFVARAGVAFTNAQYDCKLSCGTMPFVDTETKDLSGMWGIGLNMRMTQSLSLLLEYEHIGSVHHNVGNIEFQDGYYLYSVGARLTF
ncbi:MAG: outer membrane beta-barrel protein [Betaproteobacteria bacterium]|nr:outer membrane beta-barrel protein [Betaproteobacteria bacterium]MDH5221773.1 outer membrane beta-barrel protein [Betaproteobacteria bacterium]MDH5350056.1 outer membrane beta-barrel protein [Betaproteobacteria bacterium]